MTIDAAELEQLPGGDLIARGLRDLERGRETVESLLTLVGARRLSRVGLAVPVRPAQQRDVELVLYERLCAEHPADAYSRYNALLARLVSFERALEAAFYRRAGARGVD